MAEIVQLPDEIPEPWLKRVREAFREDTKKAVWLTILGSSVAAAIVTGFGNIGLEWYKAGNAAGIERYKTCLDSHREDLKLKRTEYATFSENYRLLAKDFDDCVATCEAALKNKKALPLRRFAYDSLDAVARRLIEIKTSGRNPNIDPDIRTTLAEIGDALGPAVVNVSNDQRKQPNMALLSQFIEACNKDIRPKIDGLENRIQTTIRNLQAEPCER